MQTLGLSSSTPRSEGRLRALFWPTIRNSGDLDYVTQQGFWICLAVAVMTLVVAAITGSVFVAMLDVVFYFLAGVGVRQRSRFAGLAAFFAYLLGALVLQRYTGNGFSFLRLVFLALLFANVRGNWLASRWTQDPLDGGISDRLNETFSDKLVDRMPAALWPKVRFVFYIVAGIELAFLLIALFAPIPPAGSTGL